MKNSSNKTEREILSLWRTIFSKSPEQINSIHESDCELISFKELDDRYLLATSIDTMEEEIKLGIYTDPFEIGYVATAGAISDLAAVGGEPLGILCGLTLPKAYRDDTKRIELAKGIEQACHTSGTHILGGDTNWSDHLSISITVIGKVEKKRAMLRNKINVGDHLFTTGKFGLESARAAIALLNLETKIELPLPTIRIPEGKQISKYSKSAIDTSDGMINTLLDLCELNQIGIEIQKPLIDLIHPTSLKIAPLAGLPSSLFLISEVGEYELIFSIADDLLKQFTAEHPHMIYLGRATTSNKLILNGNEIDKVRLARLLEMARVNVKEALKELAHYASNFK